MKATAMPRRELMRRIVKAMQRLPPRSYAEAEIAEAVDWEPGHVRLPLARLVATGFVVAESVQRCPPSNRAWRFWRLSDIGRTWPAHLRPPPPAQLPIARVLLDAPGALSMGEIRAAVPQIPDRGVYQRMRKMVEGGLVVAITTPTSWQYRYALAPMPPAILRRAA